MATKIEGLEKAEEAAERKYRKLRDKRSDARDKKLRAAEEVIDAELEAEYGEQIEDLRQAYWDAQQALMAAREEQAASKSPYPVGKKLVRWKRVEHGWNDHSWKIVGYGVVEICTRETVHPENIRYGRAQPGDIIVRHLTRAGEPGIQYTKLETNWREKCLPEGRDPNK